MSFTFELRVRFADTDAQGHVFFANYLTFFDEAMSAYLEAIGFPWQEMVRLGCDVVYKDARVTYEGRATFAEVLSITVEEVKLGNTSLTFTMRATQKADGSPVAGGTLVCVCVDPKAMKPTPIPEDLRGAVERGTS